MIIIFALNQLNHDRFFFVLCLSASEHIGIGPTQLNNFLTALNLPYVSKTLLKKGYEETGPALNRVAQRSIDRALQEEAVLTIGELSLEGIALLHSIFFLLTDCYETFIHIIHTYHTISLQFEPYLIKSYQNLYLRVLTRSNTNQTVQPVKIISI